MNAIFQKVIINADDFGLSAGVCTAIESLMKLGGISDTTVMMCAPDTVAYAKEYPFVFRNHCAGVHLQLPGKIAQSELKKVSLNSTVNEERVKKEEILRLDPGLVFAEWDAQIKSFIQNFKQNPTHIDTHMGYHRSAEFCMIYLELAKKYHLPVRGGEEPFSSVMQSCGVRGTTKFVRGWSGKELPEGVLKAKLLALKKESDAEKDVIEVTCHPGYVDDILKKRSGLTTGREQDYREILEIFQTNWLEKNGFKLISFRDL